MRVATAPGNVCESVPEPATSVAVSGDEVGQHEVNKARHEYSNTSELIWLNHAVLPASPNHHESLASTLNPEVEGSNPSRP